MPRRRIPVPALQHETAWQYGSPSSSPPGGSACRMSVGVGGDQQGAVYIHVHTHVCLCIAVCAHIQIHAYVCEHVCTQGFAGCTCVSAHMGTYMFVCAPMHTCTQMCVCAHVCVGAVSPWGEPPFLQHILVVRKPLEGQFLQAPCPALLEASVALGRGASAHKPQTQGRGVARADPAALWEAAGALSVPPPSSQLPHRVSSASQGWVHIVTFSPE